jgi:hypothetical protein
VHALDPHLLLGSWSLNHYLDDFIAIAHGSEDRLKLQGHFNITFHMVTDVLGVPRNNS